MLNLNLRAMSDGYRWSQEDLDRHLAKLRAGQVSHAPIPPHLSSVGDGNRLSASVSVRPRKYKNRPVLVTFAALEIVGGHQRICHTFDSQKEADHYAELCLRRHAGEISNLRLQEPYALVARREKDGSRKPCGEWLADFTFIDSSHALHVQDVKSAGTHTHLYALKKKIVEACHDITIEEV